MARLEKSSRNRMLFGVAGGLAEYLRVDPVIIRVLFILLALASGIGVFIYLILALIMPRPEAAEREPLEVVKDNLQTAPRETTEAGRRVVAMLRGPSEPTPGPTDTEAPKDEETTPQ
ncbi:MAG: PspC domain-containing protein [bacterium]